MNGTSRSDWRYKHGLCKHPLYLVWNAMKARCFNPNVKEYRYYGGRGINVCDDWKVSFIKFYNWCIENGWAKSLQLDRIDNNGDYSPYNCRFVEQKVNVNNTRSNLMVEYNKEKIPFMIACKMANVSPLTMRDRIKVLGLTFEDALKYKKKKLVGDDNYMSLGIDVYKKIILSRMEGAKYEDIARAFSVTKTTVYNIIKNRHSRFDWVYDNI